MVKEKTGSSFVLREPTSKAPQPIHFIFRFDNDRIKISTGMKIEPKFWDGSKCRVRNKVEAKDRENINDFLSKLENEAQRIFVRLQASRKLNKDSFKKEIEEYLSPPPPLSTPVELTLLGFIKDFIDKSPQRINSASGKTIEPRTIQKYKTVYSVLVEFGNTYRRKLDFETIDLDFYADFTEYLTHKKGFSVNNVGKYIQTLKTFLNEATAKGINSKVDYKSSRFKVVKEKADNVYLTESELYVLYNFDIKVPRLERVRDLFLVGCWTGLRFSDLIKLTPEGVGSDGFIRLEQAKTGGKVVIPCHPIVKAIIIKYNGVLPTKISNQKLNEYLKELCKLVGFTEPITKGITRAGVRVLKSLEKWEMVSTHTARRSFATNAYKMGIPTVTIMRITGHRTELAFLKYIKLSEEEHAQIMSDVWAGQSRQFFEVNK